MHKIRIKPIILFLLLNFLFAGIACAQTEGLPDFVVTSIEAPALANPQQEILVSWTTINQGAGLLSGGWGADLVYLSRTNKIDESTILLGNLSYYVAPSDPGAIYNNQTNIIIPETLSGAYYVLVKADGYNYINENIEENNILAKPITIGVADLAVTSISAPALANSLQEISLSWTVANQGANAAAPPWKDQLYLSHTDKIDESAIFISETEYSSSALGAGTNYTSQINITIPQTQSGTYYLLVKTDTENRVMENAEDNNILAKEITIGVADLVVTSIEAPDSANTQQVISISWTVRNQGGGPAPLGAYWYDVIYLSRTDRIDGSAIAVGYPAAYYSSSFDAGETYNNQIEITIPETLSGAYYVLVKADDYNYIAESIEENNVFAKPVTIVGYPYLPAPQNVNITTSTSEARLNWDPIPDISALQYYAVYTKSMDFSSVNGMAPNLTTSQTQATIAGLEPNSTYYFAVTAVDVSSREKKEVKTIAATTLIDSLGPELTDIRWENIAFTNGQVLMHPGEFSIAAADSYGISKVEFYIGGNLYKTITYPSYAFYWNIAKESEGAHTLKIIAYDSFANSTTLEYSADIRLAAPLAPVITQPVTGQATNNSSIIVTGSAEPESEINFYNNNIDTGVKTTSEQSGNFSATLPLTAGENRIQAAAANRAGLGSRSVEIIVTYDTTTPNPPRQLSAESKESGAIKISWIAPLGAAVKGYNLYRSAGTFSNKAEELKVNSDLITAAFITDLPLEQGQYYYRATAVSLAGNESDLSNEVIGISDNSAPKAVSIAYTPAGNYDPVSARMAPGRVDIILTVSEKLQAVPFLSITPHNASPISVELTSQSDTEYIGAFIISDTTPAGTAYAVFSARDLAGNRGTEISAGQSIEIDTQGPVIIDLKIEPKSPLKNDTGPVNVSVIVGLDEEIKNGLIPEFSYRLSGAGRTDIPVSLSISAVQPGHSQTWQGAFQLPADAGRNQVETFQFNYSASDDLGNIGTAIKPINQFQVYQNDLPPLGIPANFKGQALPNGRIKLVWDKVEFAADYQIYRKAASESELTVYVRTGDVAEYIDQPLVDGAYLYAIVSVRKENNQEAISAKSVSISLISDSSAPQPPQNLVLELTSAGIKAQWQPPANNSEVITYSLYRANTNTITSLEGLTAILKGITQISAVDSNPSELDHYYAVTAVDAAGNESLSSGFVYLNFTLLPVSSISVTQTDNAAPVVRWAYSASGVFKYNIYLGPQENRIKLNQSPLTSTTYTDSGYNQNEREYSVTAVDSNLVESIARNIFLPKITAALKDTSEIRRGLINRVEFSLQNQSAKRIDNVRLNARLHTYSHSSEPFSIEANETKIIPLIIGGYSDIPDTADFVTTIEITPNAGEKVEVIRNSQIAVKAGMLSAAIQNEEFIRGGAGLARFTLQNTGNVEIEIITASGGSPSDEIKFFLLDLDGNVLSAVPFKQDLGDGVVTLSNGVTAARIKPGAIFSSSNIAIPVPLNAPDKVFIKLDISKVHAHLNQDTHTQISGLSATREISLIDTSYYGEITLVTPLTSRGNEDITITGRAINRSTSQPLSLTALNLIIAVGGFERKNSVWTDVSGVFSYKFKPQANECGIYKVCAVHPDLLDRPEQAQFVINRLQLAPEQINLNIPRNYEHTVNIRVTAGDGTKVNNLKLVYEAVDQPEGKLAEGVHLTLEPAVSTLESLDSTNLSFKLWADNNAADRGIIVLKVKSDEAIADSWGTITLNTQFSAATPILYFSPNYVETGVKFDQAATETVTLENKGFAELRDVKLALVTDSDDPAAAPAPAWIRLNVVSELGNIAVGAKKEAVISFAPTQVTAAEGLHRFRLRVKSANYPTTDINLYVTVTQSGIGDILFKAADIFTGTLDTNNQPIQGLSSASISIQNDLIPSIQETKFSDSAGEALFTGLVSGSYKFWVTADKHRQQTGRIWVKPGITVTEEVFLSYDLVTVEWSVRETTIQDKYEIILNATYETDVPAAVIVAEPKSFSLPAMQPGDVFNAEVRFTNYGLIRADNIELKIPIDDQYFDYSALAAIPTSLSAKQSITVPVRLVCKKSLSPPGIASGAGSSAVVAGSKALAVGSSAEATANAGATGAGCVTYTNCISMGYAYTCTNGVLQKQEEFACFTSVEGECEGGGAVLYDGIASTDIWNPGEGMPPCSGSYSMPEPVPLENCLPIAEYQEDWFSPFWRWLRNLLIQVGCYVNGLTREFNDNSVDLSVKVPGGKVNIRRWFYGNKWRWDPARNNLKFEDDVMYRKSLQSPGIIKGDIRYAAVGPGIWKNGVYTITQITNGEFRWQDKHGNWIKYDSTMRVQSYGNKNGAVAAVTYQAPDTDKIDRILDRNGTAVVWFEYDSVGNITAISDAQNHKVQYEYLDNRLLKVIDVLGAPTSYAYDSAGRITQVVDAAGRPTLVSYDTYGNVSSVLDRFGTGHFFQYSYDPEKQEFYTAVTSSSGRIEETWYSIKGIPKRNDIDGKTIFRNSTEPRAETLTDEKGNVTRIEYDEWENPLKTVYPDGSAASFEYENNFNQVKKAVNQNGAVSTFEYDSSGNLIKTVKALGNENQQIITFSYDAQGQLISLTTEADATTEATTVLMSYDTNGNIASITDAMGNKTELLEYDSRGNLLQKKDSRGNTWKYAYDANSRLIKTESPTGTALSYEYDGANNVKAIINHYLKRFDFEYDDHNNCIRMTDTYEKSTLKEYNSDNLVTRSIDQEGKENKFEYDKKARLVTAIDGAGSRVSYHYDDTAAPSILSKYYRAGLENYASSYEPIQIDYPTYKKQFYYDRRQRIVRETDVIDETTNYSTKYSYDLVGNLLTLEDKEGNLTRFEYDALNRKIKTTDSQGNVTENAYDNRDNLISVKDANAGVTRYAYDKNNRLSKVINPLGKETTYDYDAVGNRISAIDAKGQKIAYEYDASNRLINTRYFKASDYVNPVKTVQFSYDAFGSLIGYNDGVTSAAYTYDDLLRKTSETVNYGAFSKTYSYTYYANGAKKTFTGADGIALEYSYDANNRLSSINIPGHGQMTNNTYQWNSPAKTTFPGGIKREYAYDPLMQVKTINALDSVNNSLMRYDYTYSAESNVLQKVTEHGSYEYQYDKLHRLISAANPQNPAESYSYDSLGNRKTAAWTSGEWQYNLNNELTGFDSTTFVYDDNGNTLSTTKAGQTTYYVYDCADKLIFVDNGLSTVDYSYDPFGRRLWKEVNGIRTYYLYSDEGLIAEYDSSGNEIKSYAYLPDSQWSTNPLYQRVNGKYYWYQNDSQGTPQKILDVTGHLVWQGTYDSFGNINITTAEIENNLRFAGQYFDNETGLYYNWNRYYNPELGRYITADPAQEGLNLYTYVFNNPNAFVDPEGLCALQELWDIIVNNFISTSRDFPKIVRQELVGAFYWPVDHPVESGLLILFGSTPVTGKPVYRVYGGESAKYGQSWTPDDPRIWGGQYRAHLGLPNSNTGQYLTRGTIKDPTGITVRGSLPLEGNPGGAAEYIIPDSQIQINFR